MTEKITSVSNPKIKDAVKLIRSASYRRESRLFVIEGLRLCRDAALSGIKIKSLFIASASDEKYAELTEAAEHIYEINEAVADKLADTKASQGVFALCEMPDGKNVIDPKGIYVAADELQDPSNLGALCRTAEALGINGVIIGGGCDTYNPKALRASMGALFRLPCFNFASLKDILPSLKRDGMRILASVPDSSAVSITAVKREAGTVCVVGNEGNGISHAVLSLCDTRVTIPMVGRAESLNAAAAASILMWELVRDE